MPVTNNIKGMLALRRIFAVQCIDELPDCDTPGAFSHILLGRVMPTAGDLATLCSMLGCTPDELYPDKKTLDLTSGIKSKVSKPRDAEHENEKEANAAAPATPAGDDDLDRLRFWLKRKEKRAFMQVITRLGYRSYSEWHRAMMRLAFERAIELNIAVTPLLELNVANDSTPAASSAPRVGLISDECAEIRRVCSYCGHPVLPSFTACEHCNRILINTEEDEHANPDT